MNYGFQAAKDLKSNPANKPVSKGISWRCWKKYEKDSRSAEKVHPTMLVPTVAQNKWIWICTTSVSEVFRDILTLNAHSNTDTDPRPSSPSHVKLTPMHGSKSWQTWRKNHTCNDMVIMVIELNLIECHWHLKINSLYTNFVVSPSILLLGTVGDD